MQVERGAGNVRDQKAFATRTTFIVSRKAITACYVPAGSQLERVLHPPKFRSMRFQSDSVFPGIRRGRMGMGDQTPCTQ